MTIYLGADHGGFQMKENIKAWLAEQKYEVVDCGNTVLDPNDDYPDFAFAVAENVAKDPANARGIVICRSGGGMTIAANKVKGIRAVDVFDLTSTVHAKTNNDANIISIGADWMQPQEALLVVENFLKAPFKGEDRHARRIQKIADYEKSH
jgi:ribose 5-phosphate isomerase B